MIKKKKEKKPTVLDPAKLEKRSRNWKLRACREHLAERRISAQSWKSMHCKGSKLKGAPDCKEGGWNKLLQMLLSGTLPTECKICHQVLQSGGFSMEDFQRDTDPSTTTLFSGKDEAVEVLGDSQEVQDGAGSEDNEKDEKGLNILQWVKDDPHLELLPPNTCKRRWPVRCLRCVRQCNHRAAVFDLVSTKNPKWFYQHVRSPTHRDNVALWNLRQKSKGRPGSDPSSGPGDGDRTHLPCQGFSVQGSKGTKLHEVREAFKLWLCYNSANALAPARADTEIRAHTYNMDAKSNDCIIFHHKCEKNTVQLNPGSRVLCSHCSLLGTDRGILRMVGRFFLKHGAARALALCQRGWMKLCGMRWSIYF